MIDQVTIKIFDFKLLDEAWFGEEIQTRAGGYARIKKISGLQKRLKAKRQYYPTVEYEKNRQEYIKVQCSVPKLLFGTNFYEPQNSDLNSFSEQLSASLIKTNIIVTPETIRQSPVRSIEFSKNIELNNVCSASEFLGKISSLNYKKSASAIRDRYELGEMIKYFNYSQSLTFYDKLREMRNKHSVFTVEDETVLSARTSEEWLKVETCLQKQQAVNGELNVYFKSQNLPIQNQYSLSDVFNSDLAKFTLMRKTGEIFKSGVKIVDLADKSKRDLLTYLNNHYHYKEAAILNLFIDRIKIQGIKKVLDTMKAEMPKASFARYMKEVNGLLSKLPTPKSRRMNVISYVANQLDRFNILRPT